MGLTSPNAAKGNWMIICPRAFQLGPPVFPQTREARSIAYYNMRFPQNHSDEYTKSLVGILQHEMHHALFKGSGLTETRHPASLLSSCG